MHCAIQRFQYCSVSFSIVTEHFSETHKGASNLRKRKPTFVPAFSTKSAHSAFEPFILVKEKEQLRKNIVAEGQRGVSYCRSIKVCQIRTREVSRMEQKGTRSDILREELAVKLSEKKLSVFTIFERRKLMSRTHKIICWKHAHHDSNRSSHNYTI